MLQSAWQYDPLVFMVEEVSFLSGNPLLGAFTSSAPHRKC
jgi:hypothetical protein